MKLPFTNHALLVSSCVLLVGLLHKEMACADCVTPPGGLVSWWKGDENGNDSVGTNNATLPNEVTYAPAEVGQGFNLDGQAHQIVVPDAPELNFSSNQNFSIEVWIQPLANLIILRI